MINKFTKFIIFAIVFWATPWSVFAHTLTSQSLGAAVSSTDVFRMNCSNNGGGAPVQVYARVKNRTSGTNALTVTIVKGKTAGLMSAKSSTDVVGSSSDSNYSPGIRLAAGAPTTTYPYFLVVTKDTATTRVYDVEAHCEAAGNIHTGTSISLIQNQ